MAKLIISGSKNYIGYLSRHLMKEHPTTKKRMEIFGFKNKRGRNGRK